MNGAKPLKYVSMLRMEDMKEFREYNCCKHVIDHLDTGMAAMESMTYLQVDLHLLMARLLENWYEATTGISKRNLEVVRSYKESRIVLEDEEYAGIHLPFYLLFFHEFPVRDGGDDSVPLETQLPSFDLSVDEDFGHAAIPDERANDMCNMNDLQMQEEEEMTYEQTLATYAKRVKGLAAPDVSKRPQRNKRPAAATISPYTTGGEKRKMRFGKRMEAIKRCDIEDGVLIQ
ncbi:hypothetical protein LINPERHAP2_LOCUS28847 [Linum perenne]